MAETSGATHLRCTECGTEGLEDGQDGFFYCPYCGARAEDIIDTGVADEDFVDKGGFSQGGALYSATHKRTQRATPNTPVPFSSQSQPFYQILSQALEPDPDDHLGPTQPGDFGSGQVKCDGAVLRDEDYYSETRMRYLMGVQLMIQYQCQALVDKFKVNPLVCGIAGPVWLRFVASTRVFDDGWADQVLFESESQGTDTFKERKNCGGDPRNIFNKRMILVWLKSLRKRIPLSCSLAVSYLACHIAREPVLPTDILRWTIEGKLSYFGAFVEIERSTGQIEKYVGQPSTACPLSASQMFRPSEAVPLQKLESMAASIAESIGLTLPPVNFYAIASRYLKQLSLPVEKLIPYACRIYEWSMPPELWLSASELRLPTRVCVLSILIVAIRILYNINGFGKWEMSLSASRGSSSMDDQVASSAAPCDLERDDAAEEASISQGLGGEPRISTSSVHKFESDTAELLHNLEKRYDHISHRHEYSKDLPTYLQYCRDVVFAESEPSFHSYEDDAEKKLIEQLWDFYQTNQQDVEASGDLDAGLNPKRQRDFDKSSNTSPSESKKHWDDEPSTFLSGDCIFPDRETPPEWVPSGDEALPSSQANQTPETPGGGDTSSSEFKDVAIRHMKIDMEEHRFCYIPPRENVKRHDYLHYVRKKDDGSLTYVAHADYYILLRACAKAAQVDARVMHAGVLSLERRLHWVEKRIDRCLQKCSNFPGESHSNVRDE